MVEVKRFFFRFFGRLDSALEPEKKLKTPVVCKIK